MNLATRSTGRDQEYSEGKVKVLVKSSLSAFGVV